MKKSTEKSMKILVIIIILLIILLYYEKQQAIVTETLHNYPRLQGIYIGGGSQHIVGSDIPSLARYDILIFDNGLANRGEGLVVLEEVKKLNPNIKILGYV